MHDASHDASYTCDATSTILYMEGILAMELLLVTFSLILLDIISGLIGAAMQGILSSKVARQGLMHKLAYVCAILLGHILDYAQSFVNLGLPFQLTIAVCTYIILCETLSIVENLAKINPELRGTKLLKLFVNTTNATDEQADAVEHDES